MEEKINNENISKEGGKIAREDAAREGGSGTSITNPLLAVIALLVLMSGVQVFQMQKLLTDISSGAVKANAQTQGNSVGLPSQVGGCG